MDFLMPAHYANLTNGVLCFRKPLNMQVYNYTRIPSTWCEQKRWDRVLYGAGPDLLMTAAQGYPVIVHDQSEKQRRTRAQWQGLSWLRYACSMAWGLPEPTEFSRTGMNVTSYWRDTWKKLGDTDKAWLEYFTPAALYPEARVDIQPCDCPFVTWTHGDGRHLLREA